LEDQLVRFGGVEAMEPHSPDLGCKGGKFVESVNCTFEGCKRVAVDGCAGRLVD
jgi:hypothetical protein